MSKRAFLLYNDQKEIVDELDDEQAGKLFKAIFEYNVNKKMTLKGALKIIFISFKTTFDRDEKKWNEISEKRSKAGKIGAKERWDSQKKDEKDDSKCQQMIANDGKRWQKMASMAVSVSDSVNVNVSDSVNDNVSESEEYNTSLAPNPSPTLDSILSFGLDLGASPQYCEKFFNHYEGIGWLNGNGVAIDNWKAVFKNWLAKDREKEERVRGAKKNEKVPDWFDKDIKPKKVDEKEKKEMEELMKEFKK